uniref:Uncharacterized protein n=1 Tax=Anguilla anguilla TaxID=7936 RepID=A0A0E9U2P8_ANGAN
MLLNRTCPKSSEASTVQRILTCDVERCKIPEQTTSIKNNFKNGTHRMQ